MSPQCEKLKLIIHNAQDGDEAAVSLLREIVSEMIKVAPVYALVEISLGWLSIGIEAGKIEAGRN